MIIPKEILKVSCFQTMYSSNGIRRTVWYDILLWCDSRLVQTPIDTDWRLLWRRNEHGCGMTILINQIATCNWGVSIWNYTNIHCNVYLFQLSVSIVCIVCLSTTLVRVCDVMAHYSGWDGDDCDEPSVCPVDSWYIYKYIVYMYLWKNTFACIFLCLYFNNNYLCCWIGGYPKGFVRIILACITYHLFS